MTGIPAYRPQAAHPRLALRPTEFKMLTTNKGYGIRLKACFRIALTEADKLYISPEHTFDHSDLGYSLKVVKHFYKEMMKIKS